MSTDQDFIGEAQLPSGAPIWIATLLLSGLSTLLVGSMPLILNNGNLPIEIKSQWRNLTNVKVNINTASPSELGQIPGINSRFINQIITLRKVHLFQTASDLLKIKGLGNTRLAQIEQWLIFSPTYYEPEVAKEPIPASIESNSFIRRIKENSLTRKPLPIAKIDCNHADQAMLEQLPGIGPGIATKIIQYRAEKIFSSVNELLFVPGIGPKTLEKIRPYLIDLP